MKDFLKKMTKGIQPARSSEIPEVVTPEQETDEPRDRGTSTQVPSPPEMSETISLYQKCTDKISMDLVSSVENMISDRQLAFYRINELEDLIANANDHIFRLNRETERLNKLVQEKDETIHGLEERMTAKQMSYDQLLEDFGAYQDNTKVEINDLKFQLDKSQGKYEILNQEFRNSQADYSQKVNLLDERIRDLEVQNQRVTAEYRKTLDDKNKLLQTINNFTESMNLSLNIRTEKPINLPKEDPELKDPGQEA